MTSFERDKIQIEALGPSKIKQLRMVIWRNVFRLQPLSYMANMVGALVVVLYLTESAYMTDTPVKGVILHTLGVLFGHLVFALYGTPYVLMALNKYQLPLSLSSLVCAFIATFVSLLAMYGDLATPREQNNFAVFRASLFAVGFGSALIWLYFVLKLRSRFEEVLVKSECCPRSCPELAGLQTDMLTTWGNIDINSVTLMKASKNYTEIHMGEKVRLLREPISRLAEEIPIEGERIHRSYWVADSELKRVYFDNGNAKLETMSGQHIPISRKSLSKVRERLQRQLSTSM